MWARFKKLKEQGVLSINRRNSDYVLRYNARKYYPLVDDKFKTKQLAIAANITVPPLYATIKAEHEITHVHNTLKSYSDFVIKPACGAGGDGIIVISDRVFGRYRQINGHLLTESELEYHLSQILSGAYSLGGHPDYAIIEHRVIVDPVFSSVSYEGIPDIRVIVLQGYPVMSMVRLPTRISNGKANLHQGAIGVGICIATGKTLGGVFHNEVIDYHPDTLNPITNIEIPYWDKILELAASCFELTNLGYLGVDIVLDKLHGPLILELNARPGLNIQIANREGALKRYQIVESHIDTAGIGSLTERIDFSKKHFRSYEYLLAQ